jgi:hypothetical protein
MGNATRRDQRAGVQTDVKISDVFGTMLRFQYVPQASAYCPVSAAFLSRTSVTTYPVRRSAYIFQISRPHGRFVLIWRIL